MNENNTTNMAQSTGMPFDYNAMIEALSMNNIAINEFNGDEEQDALKWINLFERSTRLWKEETRFQQVKYYLEGSAKNWFKEIIEPKKDQLCFADFKKLFLKEYVDADKREHAMEKLRKMKYDPSLHRINNFVVDFRHWNKTINPHADFKVLVRDLFDRFPISFQAKFLNSKSINSVKDFDDFIEIAKNVEKIIKLESKVTENSFHANATRVDANNELLRELLLEVRAMRAEREEKKSKQNHNKVCFKCSKSWPGCGCTSKCRRCNGQFPTCGCGKRDKPVNQGN